MHILDLLLKPQFSSNKQQQTFLHEPGTEASFDQLLAQFLAKDQDTSKKSAKKFDETVFQKQDMLANPLRQKVFKDLSKTFALDREKISIKPQFLYKTAGLDPKSIEPKLPYQTLTAVLAKTKSKLHDLKELKFKWFQNVQKKSPSQNVTADQQKALKQNHPNDKRAAKSASRLEKSENIQIFSDISLKTKQGEKKRPNEIEEVDKRKKVETDLSKRLDIEQKIVQRDIARQKVRSVKLKKKESLEAELATLEVPKQSPGQEYPNEKPVALHSEKKSTINEQKVTKSQDPDSLIAKLSNHSAKIHTFSSNVQNLAKKAKKITTQYNSAKLDQNEQTKASDLAPIQRESQTIPQKIDPMAQRRNMHRSKGLYGLNSSHQEKESILKNDNPNLVPNLYLEESFSPNIQKHKRDESNILQRLEKVSIGKKRKISELKKELFQQNSQKSDTHLKLKNIDQKIEEISIQKEQAMHVVMSENGVKNSEQFGLKKIEDVYTKLPSSMQQTSIQQPGQYNQQNSSFTQGSNHEMAQHALTQNRQELDQQASQRQQFIINLDHARVKVQFINQAVHMHFYSSASMQIDAGVEQYVDKVMQMNGFDRYKVTLKDREKRKEIVSSPEVTIHKSASSIVDVKI